MVLSEENLTASPDSGAPMQLAVWSFDTVQPPMAPPLSPNDTHGTRQRRTRAARRLKVHRQPRTHRGEPDGAPHARTRRTGRERRKEGASANGEEGRTRVPHNYTGHPETSALRGTKA